MSTLTRFESNDGIELVIDINTGEAFATVSGYAIRANLTRDGIYKRISRGYKGVDKSCLKRAEILTPGGLQGVDMLSANIVFEWLMNDNPSLALAMGKAGATVYMQHLAGFKLELKQTTSAPVSYIEALKALVASEEAKELLAQENTELIQEVGKLSEIVDELFNYSSIIRIVKYNKVDGKIFTWRRLKSVSENFELEIKKAPCPRYVTKNLYHHDAWRFCYPFIRLPEEAES